MRASLTHDDALQIQVVDDVQGAEDRKSPAVPTKINRFTVAPNQWLFPRCPVSTRGAYRDRHEREAGCGGRGSVRREKCLQGGYP